MVAFLGTICQKRRESHIPRSQPFAELQIEPDVCTCPRPHRLEEPNVQCIGRQTGNSSLGVSPGIIKTLGAWSGRIPALSGRGRWSSVSSRTAWFTGWVPAKAIQKNLVSKNKYQKQTRRQDSPLHACCNSSLNSLPTFVTDHFVTPECNAFRDSICLSSLVPLALTLCEPGWEAPSSSLEGVTYALWAI